jgi:hypothetical protein
MITVLPPKDFDQPKKPKKVTKRSAKTKKEGELSTLRIDSTKAVWRELSAILQLGTYDTVSSGPFALSRARSLSRDSFSVWSGGYACERAKKINILEWVYSVPVGIFGQVGSVYLEMVRSADRLSWAVGAALERALNAESMPFDRRKRYAPLKALKSYAQNIYWATLEAKVPQFIQELCKDPASGREFWVKAIKSAVFDSYKKASETGTVSIIHYVNGSNFLKSEVSRVN